ncbi:hypothetical protein RB598_006309 [Gaeumannomyces tritici]
MEAPLRSQPLDKTDDHTLANDGDGHHSRTMARRKLDLLVLTFNAAKTIIDSHVFAHHLQTALAANATPLPEVVVFSLQEVSPLSYAFIGGVFLNPFLARYEDALNLAAVKVQSTPPSTLATTATTSFGFSPANNVSVNADSSEEPGPQTSLLELQQQSKPYTLVQQHNVGMTAVMVFARDPSAVSQVELAEVGFGTMDMGNKGAAGVRCLYADKEGGGRTTQLTFVATHLAPMEWNLRRRNANWRTICSALLFGEPTAVIKRAAGDEGQAAVAAAAAATSAVSGGRAQDSAACKEPTAEEEEEAERLLAEAEAANGALAADVRDALRDITIFRPGSHLFLAGDLNYRISERSPQRDEPFPSLEMGSQHHWSTFLDRDQLSRERAEGRALQGLEEAPVNFAPTYKYHDLPTADGALNEAQVREAEANGLLSAGLVVPFRFAKHRWPSWTDRVLYAGVPADAPARRGQGEDDETARFDVVSYQSLPLMRSSDHQPVFLRVRVPILSPEELGRPSPATPASNEVGGSSSRAKKPLYPIDIHAAARRRAARSREFATGWTMLLWCTREGAVALGSLAVLGLSTYWLYQAL